MDNLQFVSELCKSLAWPSVAGLALLVFRREIKQLSLRLKKGRLGDAELEFEKEVEVLSENRPSTTNPPEITDRDKALAEADPRGAIVKTWMEVEYSARRAFHHFDILYTGTPHTPFLGCIAELEKKNVLSFDDVILIRELQMLRRRSITDTTFSPTPESVLQYIALTKAVRKKLDAATPISQSAPPD